MGVNSKAGADVRLVKQINTVLVMNALKRHGPLSRHDLSRATDLTPPTVSAIIELLMTDGLVTETGMGASAGGRRPVILELNPHGVFSVGVEIGDDGIHALLVDLLARERARVTRTVRVEDGADAILTSAAEAIREVIAQGAVPLERVRGAGVGITGLVNPATGVVVRSSRLNWQNVPVGAVLQELTGLPVLIENNVRAITLGEWWLGAGVGERNLLCIRVGQGIGLGMIIQGALYAGAHNYAGEFGHFVVQCDGERCVCGRTGCLETVASGRAIARQAGAAVANGCAGPLRDLSGGRPEGITASLVVHAAQLGDHTARQLIAEAGHMLGVALASAIRLLDPRRIVISSGLLEAGEVFFGAVTESLGEELYPEVLAGFELVPGSLGRDACAMGAAALHMGELFRVPALMAP